MDFPSDWENFPLVGLEAMAPGKAIVATELGFSEYLEIGREGLLVKRHGVQGAGQFDKISDGK